VTVPDSPSGAPTATTGWPIFTDDDELSEITLSWQPWPRSSPHRADA